MTFDSFINELGLKQISSYKSKDYLIEFRKKCIDEDDFIQFNELENILSVENIFEEIYQEYENIKNPKNLDNLITTIENISTCLESNDISCYSYSFYIYAFLNRLIILDASKKNSKKIIKELDLEKIEWTNPKKFEYSMIGKTTFGIDLSNSDTGFVKAIPDYKKFNFSNNILKGYYGKKKYIVIPSFIKQIAENAFANNKFLKMIIIPNSVTEIGASAFKHCSNLQLVHVSEKVTSLPKDCFAECKNLKYVSAPKVTKVTSSFQGCTSLTHVDLPKLQSINELSFCNCSSLSEFNFIENIKSIGNKAFYNTKIESLTLSNIETLGEEAFGRCDDLNDITILSDKFGQMKAPFKDCNNIKSIKLKCSSFPIKKLFTYDNQKFSNNSIESIEAPIALDSLCEGLNGLQKVVITDKTEIFKNAFKNCKSLKSLKFLENKVNIIGDSAFENCQNLVTLDINFLGKAIGEKSFYKCSKIKNFNFLYNVQNFHDLSLAYCDLSNTTFNFNENEVNDELYYFGRFAFANCKFKDNLDFYLDNATILPGAFHGIIKINYLSIQNANVSEANYFAMFERDYNTFVNNVYINSIITTFTAREKMFENGKYNFIQCNIADGIIPESLFEGCTKLESCALDGKVAMINDNAFKNCEKLDFIDMELSEAVVLGNSSFENCKIYNFEDLNNLIKIGKKCFYNSGLSSIETINQSLEVGDLAFGQCKLTKEIVIPESNDLIDNNFFGRIFSDVPNETSDIQIINNKKYYFDKNIKKITYCGKAINDNFFDGIDSSLEIYFKNLVSFTDQIKIPNDSKLRFGSKLVHFAPLYNNTNICYVIDPDNKYFFTNNNSIYSFDKSILYYSLSNDKYLTYVKSIESNSLLNYKSSDLKLIDLDVIKTHSININNIDNLQLSNISKIEPNSLIYTNTNPVFETLLIDNVDTPINIFTKAKEYSIATGEFNNLNNLDISSMFSNSNLVTFTKQLTFRNVTVKNESFKNVSFKSINFDNCEFNNFKLDNYDSIVFSNCNLSDVNIIDKNSYYKNIKIINCTLGETFLQQLKCDNLSLEDLDNLPFLCLKGSVLSNINLKNIKSIEPGFMYGAIYTNLSLVDLKYTLKDNMIIDGNNVILYRPNKSNAILSNKYHYPEYSIDLSNVKTLDVEHETFIDTKAIYNNERLKNLTIGKVPDVCIKDLFIDEINISNINFTYTFVPIEYFADLPSIKRIELPEDVDVIESFAFSNDKSLEEVININKALYYGDLIFSNCLSIKEIIFNDNSLYFGLDMLSGCTSIKKVTIPIIEERSYLNNSMLDMLGNIPNLNEIEITIGKPYPHIFDGVNCNLIINNPGEKILPEVYSGLNILDIDLSNTKNISAYAFKDCSFGNKVDLSNIEEIGSHSFENVILQDKLCLRNCMIISDYAFSNCGLIKQVELSKNLEQFDITCFKDTNVGNLSIDGKGKLYNVINNNLLFKHELIYLTDNAIENGKLIIPADVNVVDTNAISYNNNLKEINFSNVVSINENAVNNCPNLTSIVINNKLENNNGNCFVNCPKVTDIIINSIANSNIKSLSDYFVIDGSNISLPNLVNLTITGLELTEGELDFNNKINKISLENSIENLPDFYFSRCKELSYINIPTNCISIGSCTFKDTKIDAKDLNVTNIIEYGDECFANTNTTQFTFGKHVKKIGQGIFNNCNIIDLSFENKLDIPSVSYLGINNTINNIKFANVNLYSEYFKGYENLLNVDIDQISNNCLPDKVFKGFNKLKHFCIKSDIEIIPNNCFESCSSLNSLILSNYKKIGKFAFKDTLITNKDLDTYNVTEFGEECFANTNIAEFAFNKNVIQIEKNIFKGCNIVSLKFENNLDIPSLSYLGFNNAIKSIYFNNIKIYDDFFNGYDSIQEIEIEHIDNNALPDSTFKDFKNLNSIIIKSDIDKIPNSCFEGCESLNNIQIYNYKEIGEYAFKDCINLKEFIFSPSCSNVSKGAFTNVKINKLTVSGEKNLQLDMFNKDSIIKTLDIDFKPSESDASIFVEKHISQSLLDNLENITFSFATFETGSLSAFNKLSTIEFKYGLNIIPPKFCANMISLKSFKANSIQEIKEEAFCNCSNLENICLDKCYSVASKAFQGCSSLLIPSAMIDNIETIGESAFVSCKFPMALVFNKIISIGSNAFSSANNVGKISFNSNDCVIGNNAFSNILSLKQIEFNSACDIKDEAFIGCSKLEAVINSAPIIIGSKAFLNCKNLDLKYIDFDNIYSIGSFALDTQKYLSHIIIGEKLESLSNDAFGSLKDLRTIYINNEQINLKEILANCKSISTLNFEKVKINNINEYVNKNLSDNLLSTVNTIEFNDISNLTGNLKIFKLLTTLTVKKDLEIFPDSLCQDCNNLVYVNLEKCEKIGKYAFYNCVNLNHLSIRNVKVIGDYAFTNCKKLLYSSEFFIGINKIGVEAFKGNHISNINPVKPIVFNSLDSIGKEAFMDTSGYINIKIVSDLKNIPVNCFKNSTLKTIFIRSCPSIDNSAFENCKKLEKLDAHGVISVGDNCFKKCAVLNSFNTPLLKKIGNNAFDSCAQFSKAKISLPMIETIGNEAYANTDIKELRLSKSLVSIGTSILKGNTKSVDIYLPKSFKDKYDVNYFLSGTKLSKLLGFIKINRVKVVYE